MSSSKAKKGTLAQQLKDVMAEEKDIKGKMARAQESAAVVCGYCDKIKADSEREFAKSAQQQQQSGPKSNMASPANQMGDKGYATPGGKPVAGPLSTGEGVQFFGSGNSGYGKQSQSISFNKGDYSKGSAQSHSFSGVHSVGHASALSQSQHNQYYRGAPDEDDQEILANVMTALTPADNARTAAGGGAYHQMNTTQLVGFGDKGDERDTSMLRSEYTATSQMSHTQAYTGKEFIPHPQAHGHSSNPAGRAPPPAPATHGHSSNPAGQYNSHPQQQQSQHAQPVPYGRSSDNYYNAGAYGPPPPPALGVGGQDHSASSGAVTYQLSGGTQAQQQQPQPQHRHVYAQSSSAASAHQAQQSGATPVGYGAPPPPYSMNYTAQQGQRSSSGLDGRLMSAASHTSTNVSGGERHMHLYAKSASQKAAGMGTPNYGPHTHTHASASGLHQQVSHASPQYKHRMPVPQAQVPPQGYPHSVPVPVPAPNMPPPMNMNMMGGPPHMPPPPPGAPMPMIRSSGGTDSANNYNFIANPYPDE